MEDGDDADDEQQLDEREGAGIIFRLRATHDEFSGPGKGRGKALYRRVYSGVKGEIMGETKRILMFVVRLSQFFGGNVVGCPVFRGESILLP
jgi:hypothetical protein